MFRRSDKTFLGAAFLSFVASVALWFFVNHDYGAYVGLWVPSILILWTGVRICSLEAASNEEGQG